MRDLDNYLQEIQMLEEFRLINEDMFSLIRSFSKGKVDKIMTKLQHAIKTRRLSKIQKSLVGIPEIPLEHIKKAGSKMSPDFIRSFKFISRNLKDSYSKVPDKVIDYLACIIAFKSCHDKTKNAMVETKDNLLAFRKLVSMNRGKVVQEQVFVAIGIIITVIFTIIQFIIGFIATAPWWVSILILVCLLTLIKYALEPAVA